MGDMLDRIKDRIVEKDCPIKSIKALVEKIGMSEAGFYSMVKKGTTKVKTMEAICSALEVPNDYFEEGNSERKESSSDFADNILQKIEKDMREMKQMFEDQLRAKDTQIAGLQRMLETVLGKPEGAILEPLFTEAGNFEKDIRTYAKVALAGLMPGDSFFIPFSVAK
jgi:DNA-binding Xre family transcriptional regulator